MTHLATSLSVIAMILAPAQAEIRTLPGSTIEVAVTRIECSVVIDGEELMNGTCHLRVTDRGQVFMTLPEAATQIAVNVSRRRQQGRMVRLWMSSPEGKPRQEILGRLRVQPECGRKDAVTICCYANERVRICSQPIEADPPPGPPTLSEQQSDEQMEEINEKMNKLQEKLTKQR
jgi:hypothetical protein